jgi:hypothetical protein
MRLLILLISAKYPYWVVKTDKISNKNVISNDFNCFYLSKIPPKSGIIHGRRLKMEKKKPKVVSPSINEVVKTLKEMGKATIFVVTDEKAAQRMQKADAAFGVLWEMGSPLYHSLVKHRDLSEDAHKMFDAISDYFQEKLKEAGIDIDDLYN